MAAVALFAHRNLIFEQRTSANQYRASRAFEMAEAGLEWATARLNDPRGADAACQAAPPGPSLRDRLLRGTAAAGFDPDGDVRAACRADATGWTCSCPASGQPLALDAGEGPVFVVRLEPVAEDAHSVRLVSLGCSDPAPPCLPDVARDDADAQAQASVVLKAGPLLRMLPSAALTAAGRVQLGGAGEFVNRAPGGTGRLVDAGAAVDTGSTLLQTLPGSPAADALLADDPVLSRLQAGGPEAVSRAWFGREHRELPLSTTVRRVEADDPVARGALLRRWHDEGFRVFHLGEETTLDGSELGSPSQPVLLLAEQSLHCAAPPCVVHGLVHGGMGARLPGDLAGFEIHGAVTTAGDHVGGDLRIRYAPQTLLELRHRSAALHRVPGSWRDF
jgi:hypothetical protein